jgi:hypothetical protein
MKSTSLNWPRFGLKNGNPAQITPRKKMTRPTFSSAGLPVMVFFISLCSSGQAQTAVPCLSESGEKVLVPLYYTHPGDDIAKTTPLPNPAIYVDPAIQTFSSAAQMLIFNHECHHATHTYINENEADVYAGMLMRKNGVSSGVTRNAAEEVFRWTVANNGHSIPAVRVALVMEGYSATDESGARDSGGGIPRECGVSAVDLDAVDVSKVVPSYIVGSKSAIERRLNDRQELLAGSIDGCKKAVERMHRYPGDSRFMQFVTDAKGEIAMDQAYIRKLNEALAKVAEDFTPAGPALFSFARINYGDGESAVINRLGDPTKRVELSSGTELQFFDDALAVYLNKDGQVTEVSINSLNDRTISVEPSARSLIGRTKSVLISRFGVRSNGDVDIGDYACRFADSSGHRGVLHLYFNDDSGKSNVADVLWLRPNDRLAEVLAPCK